MDRTERLNESVERLGHLGLCLKLDCGLIGARETADGDPGRRRTFVEELGKYLPELCYLLQQRAIGARAKELSGQSVWSPEFGEGADGDSWADHLNPKTYTSIAANHQGMREHLANCLVQRRIEIEQTAEAFFRPTAAPQLLDLIQRFWNRSKEFRTR